MDYAVHDADVLVIGGGIAGAMAAIRASELGARVVLVDKAFFGRSGCSALASGVIGAWTPDFTEERWLKAKGGNRANQQFGVRTAPLSQELLAKMDAWGVKLVKHDGRVVPVPGTYGFPSAMLDGGGPQMMMALRRETLRRGVVVVNRVMVNDLLTSDGRQPTGGSVSGAVGLNVRTGEICVFCSKSTIVCTGPYKLPYPTTPVFRGMPIDLSGDGQAAMLRAGAVLSRMSGGSLTVMPTEFFNSPGLELLTSLGCKFVNCRGENLLEKYGLGPGVTFRANLSHAVVNEVRETGEPVFLDIRHFSQAELDLSRGVLPIIIGNYESAGYDLSKDVIPYITIMLGSAGIGGAGAHLNERCETSLDGLFAAGNCCDSAFMASAMNLTECAINGWLAGESAASRATNWPTSPARSPEGAQVDELGARLLAPLQKGSGAAYRALHEQTEQFLLDVGIFQCDGKLAHLLARVADLRRAADDLTASDVRELVKALSLTNYLQVLEAVLTVIRHRTESRGFLFRTDYPYTDNESWLSWTMFQLQTDGSYRVWDEEIPRETFLREPKRSRVLHPIFRETKH